MVQVHSLLYEAEAAKAAGQLGGEGYTAYFNSSRTTKAEAGMLFMSGPLNPSRMHAKLPQP